VPTYTLELPALLAPDPEVAEDGTAFHPLAAEELVAMASRAGVSVAAAPAAPGDTALALTDRALSAPDPDTLLVDVEACSLAGGEAVRVLLLVQLGGLATVVLEQWRLVAAGGAWLVTATADLAAWAALGPAFRGAVATLSIQDEDEA
jgi:hypothetical protein